MNTATAIDSGIHNLLFNCMGLQAGDDLLIVRELGRSDYYSATLPDLIAAEARASGISVVLEGAPFLEEVREFPRNISAAMSASDHTLFLARIGDQLRFSDSSDFSSQTMCYALDEESFATPFCSADYEFFRELKHRINGALFGEKQITIRCREGTHLVGVSPKDPGDENQGDVTVRRFPLTVFRPMSAATFSGRLAISKWLSPTGSRFYQPASVIIDEVVFAEIRNGRITGFEGNRRDVEKIQKHYAFVSGKYGIDRDVIHSWHAGIHPQNGYNGLAIDNLTRWGGSAFGNPRYLHLHTCGDYAPGEICVSAFDPTITADDTVLWSRGELVYAQAPEIQDLMVGYPGMKALFANPQREFGLGESQDVSSPDAL